MDRPDDLRALLTALNTHLASNGAALPPATARELEIALDLLRGRIARQEESPGFIEPFSRQMQEGGEPRPASEALASPPPHAWSDGASRSRRGASPEPWPIRLVLASSTGAAALSALGAAVLGFSVADIPGVRPTTPAPVARAVGDADPRGDMAAQDLRIAATKAAPTDPRPPGATSPGAPSDSYDSAAAALRRGDAQGLSRLTGLAQDGDTRAQLHLAGLYETGQGGLPRDLSAARLWTRRAAGGGDPMAMHNLALFLMEGDGGPRDVSEAAAWFRRAAQRGVVDSQYNLGLLYEAGQGVTRSPREAYRWFSVAANAGDVSAREKQVLMEARLAPAERADLDREVAAFQPGAISPDRQALVVSPAATIAESQALLARRGYFLGAIDGVSSPGYATAVAAWRKDHPESP